jgi:hypothetical protein
LHAVGSTADTQAYRASFVGQNGGLPRKPGLSCGVYEPKCR